MTCDEGRPCQRCIKRNIAHLCHDPPNKNGHQKPEGAPPEAAPNDTKPDPSLVPQHLDIEPPQFDPLSLGLDTEFGGASL